MSKDEYVGFAVLLTIVAAFVAYFAAHNLYAWIVAFVPHPHGLLACSLLFATAAGGLFRLAMFTYAKSQ